MRTNYIIGCGGVGSWLAPSLDLLRPGDGLILMDGDRLEEGNLNRQLFETEFIGRNKAEALAEKYDCGARPQWYSIGLIEHNPSDWLLCCVDNNPARLAVLQSCDEYGCQAIFAANETNSAEAYYYRRAWRDGPLDPRVYYPTMLTDTDNDPRGESTGCTGEVQQQNPQLVTANSMAAALAGHLYVLWAIKAGGLDKEVIPSLPYKLVANLSRLESHLIKDKLEKGEAK